MDRTTTTARWDEKHLSFGILVRLILDVWRQNFSSVAYRCGLLLVESTHIIPENFPCTRALFQHKGNLSGYGGMGFSIGKIMGIPILLKRYFYIEKTHKTILQSPNASEVILEYMCNVNPTTTPYAYILRKYRSQYRSLPIIWSDIFL